jgi:hypothetical protein
LLLPAALAAAGCLVGGSAHAACTPAEALVLAQSLRHDQGNGIDPTYDRHFQEFRLSQAAEITGAAALLFRDDSNSDRDLLFSIYTVDDAHLPAVQVSGTEVRKPNAEISTTESWATVALPAPVQLQAGQYALVLQLGSGSASRGYHWAREYDAADPYPAGISGYWYPFVGGRWVTTQELDYAFSVSGCSAPQTAEVPALGPFGLTALAACLLGIAYFSERRATRRRA